MNAPDVGKLEKAPLRKVRPDEAADFTPWLVPMVLDLDLADYVAGEGDE